MGIDQLGSRFDGTTAKRKRAATQGITSWECVDRRHFRCREKDCACRCHVSEIPKLKPRPVEDVA